jgi:sugar O-acyltransferase (sialic acid O-acetyltransferase NeuD family)
MTKSRKLLLVGDSAFAEVAYEYFTHDSEYEVVAFAVESQFLKKTRLFDLPVMPFETVEEVFDPTRHEIFVAVVYSQLNRLRARLCADARRKGFKTASYVSSRAFVWRNAVLGEHCFIFENNVVQPFVRIGSNVVLWAGNHVGHHAVIGDNCFVSSHVVLSGFSEIGENCFLGVNSTISNGVKIAKDCWIGPGVTITSDTSSGELYRAEQTGPAKVSTYRFFKVRD